MVGVGSERLRFGCRTLGSGRPERLADCLGRRNIFQRSEGEDDFGVNGLMHVVRPIYTCYVSG